MSERYKLTYTRFDGEKETHIENVSYTMALVLKKLLVMQGENEDGLDIEDDSDDDLDLPPTGLLRRE
jgi:hypothetical protein